jgi:capsular polysaccharide transport system permease protein
MKDMTMGGLITLQARVIGAMVLRETRATFGTSHLGYLWAIVTPSASVAVLVLVFSAVGREPPFGSSLALFFATGILTLEFFNKLSNTLMGTFTANKALLSYPPIKMTDALFARLILISATYLLIMVIFYSGLILLNLAEWPSYPETLVQAFAATALLGFGFGTLNAVIISLWDSWLQIEKILTRPLFFISGIFYIPSNLPPEAIYYLKWNPVLHLIEWIRMGYYPNYDSTIFDETYLLGTVMILLLFGLVGERLFRKQRV